MLAVPMDHGFTLGPVTGLVDLNNMVQQVFQGGASCVITQKGMLRSIHSSIPAEKGYLVHLSGSTTLSPTPNIKVMTGSVANSVFLGADGVSCHVNLGASGDTAMIQDMNFIVEEADQVGMPVLAMMYVRNDDGVDSLISTHLAHACRVAEETGVDIVKINATPNGNGFDEVTQGIGIPVVVAGGSKQEDFNGFLNTIKQCILQGASGVSIGRNVFQAADPKKAMEMVRKTVMEAAKEVDHIGNLS